MLKVFRVLKGNDDMFLAFDLKGSFVSLLRKEDLVKNNITSIEGTLIEKEVSNVWFKEMLGPNHNSGNSDKLKTHMYTKDLNGNYHQLLFAIGESGVLEKSSRGVGVSEKFLSINYGKGLIQ